MTANDSKQNVQKSIESADERNQRKKETTCVVKNETRKQEKKVNKTGENGTKTVKNGRKE